MKKILPSLALALTSLLPGALHAQQPQARFASGAVTAQNFGAGQGGAPQNNARRSNPIASAKGQAVARQAIVAVDSQRSLYMQLRQRISMFDQQLVGTGIYQQLGEAEERRLRLDLKVKVADQMTSMQQVCNGRFLYIRRDLGGSSHLGRVDLRRIREVMHEADAADGNLAASQQWMMLGGMPQLLGRLEKNFQFTAPQQAVLENTQVTVVDGFWKPEALLALLPDHKDAIAAGKPIDAKALSPQLPTQIRLVVRGEDSFPLRIEYLRSGKAVEPDQPPPMTTIMAMEFFDIRLGQAIDPLTFVYEPGNQEVADHTEVYLNSLGLNRTRQASREDGERR